MISHSTDRQMEPRGIRLGSGSVGNSGTNSVTHRNALPDRVQRPAVPITAEIKTPTEALEALHNPEVHWLTELREMRGQVLYNEGGHDPSFLSRNGSFTDEDPFDVDAHHVLLRAAQRIVACARVSLLRRGKPSFMSTFLGPEKFEQILYDLGASWETSCEASRWVVASEFRNLGLGPRVVAAAWILARSLEMQTAFVFAGTRYGQDRMLCRMGAQPVCGLPTIPVGPVADEGRLLRFDISVPAEITKKKMDRTATLRDLPIFQIDMKGTERSNTWLF